MKDNVIKRAEMLAASLKQHGADAFVVLNDEDSNWESLYYLSGFRGTAGALAVFADGSSEMILDGRYIEQGREQSPHKIFPLDQRLVHDISERLNVHGAKKILCEADKTSHRTWESLAAPTLDVEDGTALIKYLRRTKAPLEVDCIIKAADIAAEAFLGAIDNFRIGMTEKEFEAFLNYKINLLGGESGFDMVVASGVRSAMPHGRASEKEIKKGEWVTVDFSARYQGYFCDITRNFSVGEPDERALFLHDVLQKAHRAGADNITAGKSGTEIHNASLKVLERYGVGDKMTHSLGHGFGLEIHEAPYLSPRRDDTLQLGDIVTIEPGVYFEGWGGLRLEDDYLVTDNGSKRLTDRLNQCFYRI